MADGPDQGFAWVIAFACFFINFIMAGLARTAGVLYVAVINLYGVSREAATTPFSIRVCIRNLTGPLIGLLGEKYGIRSVTAIGGLVAALGSMLCYFAPNVFWLTMFWGIIHGLGFGLSTILHMITINQYFDKYKASALGLGYSGDCFGTFTFPVLMEYLISHYGLKGAFLIAGGMVLNVIPMALLLRKPSWLNNTKKSAGVKRNSKSKKKDQHSLKKHKNSIFVQRNRMLKTHSHAGCLSAVKENEEQADDFQNNESAEDVGHLVTFGIDSRGQYNKGFESSETSLNLVGNRNETKNSLAFKKEDKLESLKATARSPQMHRLNPALSNSSHRPEVCSTTSSANDSKRFLMPEDIRVGSQITSSRSVTDLNRRNGSFCHGSPRLGLGRILLEQQRRDSLPLVLAKDKCLKDKNEKMLSLENMKNEKLGSHESVKNDTTQDTEVPPAAMTGISKKRTSSFVGLVAQDIANRMRTASFASQLAQDGFVATIGQESESESECEEETECQLTSIVEHRDHDTENCTHNDLILSIDKNMVEDYFSDSPEKPEKEIEEKPQVPSILKLLLRTNTKPMFVLISMSLAVYVFLFVSILTIIIDYAKDLGVEEDRGKYLIIGFSVADLFGRLSFGLIIDRNLMKMKNYASATFILMGALVAVIPLNTSFNYMMVCMCMYGVVQGGSAIMFPILINLYMEKNLESVAMGSLNFYGGVLMLLMAPMIGYFRDNHGSYNNVFYVTGGVVLVVGIFWQFEPMIVKFQNRKLREKYIMREMSLQQIAG